MNYLIKLRHNGETHVLANENEVDKLENACRNVGPDGGAYTILRNGGDARTIPITRNMPLDIIRTENPRDKLRGFYDR